MDNFKVDVKETHPCQREMTIEVSPEAIEDELQNVYRRLGRSKRIPGFRPGKAPRSVLEKYFGKEARGEAVGNRVSQSYNQALREQDLKVLGDPAFGDLKEEENGPVVFKVTVDVSPEVDVKNYHGVRLAKQAVRVDEKEVEEALDSLRERSASFEAVEDRPLKEGDWALVDYRGIKDPDAKWMEGVMLEIKPSPDQDFPMKLVGLEPGRDRKVEITSPGGPEEVEIRLKEIKKKIIPELNDELVRNWGDFKGLAEVKEKLRENIREKKEATERLAMENQLVAYLLKKHDFPLPPLALERLVEDYLKEMERLQPPGEGDGETKGKSDDELRADARQRAENDLRLLFILDEIARREKIEADPKEIGEEIVGLARQQGIDPGEYRRRLEEEGRISTLAARQRRRRVIEFLLKEAKVKEGK